MNFGLRVISKVKRVATEQVGQSFASGLVAGNIKGNYILMYHGVTSKGSRLFNKRHISVRCFEKQIRFLKKHFSIISLSDFFEEKFDETKPNFAITFDDGYLNNYNFAKPVLEKYQCPASFFITGLNEAKDNMIWGDLLNLASYFTDEDLTVDGERFRKKNGTYSSYDTGKSIYDIIRFERAGYDYKQEVRKALAAHLNFETNRVYNEYWELMTDAQIAETSRSQYITIGSHAYYHNNLGVVPHQEAMDELTRSKNYLEALTQKKIDQVAFPDGSYTLKLSDDAFNMGFAIQLAADRFLFDKGENEAHLKKRYGIYAIDSCLNQLFTALKHQG